MRKTFLYRNRQKLCLLLLAFSLGIAMIGCSEDEPKNEGGSGNEEVIQKDFIKFADGVESARQFTEAGGTLELTFETNADWTASMVNGRADGWIEVSPQSGTKGKATIVVTALANETNEERNASLKLIAGKAEKVLSFTQKQKDALLVSSATVDVPAGGGSFQLEVKANIDFTVEVACDWIKQVESRALTATVLNFEAAENLTDAKREGEIIISGNGISETVKVYQANGNSLTVTADSFYFSDEGGTFDVELKTTEDFEVKFPAVDWITEDKSRAISTHTFHYTVLPNETYETRSAEIIYVSKDNALLADTVRVFQTYRGAILVSGTDYKVGSEGGNLEVKVATNLDLNVSVDVAWIKQLASRGLDEFTLRFAVDAYDGTEPRMGHIVLRQTDGEKEQIITVSQEGVSGEEDVRKALMALYEATGGDNWKDNTNWGSDKPLSEWFGLKVNNSGLYYVNLPWNNLKGEIPDEFYGIKTILHLNLEGNELTGEISPKISDWTNLYFLGLYHNQFVGSIPQSLTKLVNLRYFSLFENKLTGELPAGIENMPNWDSVIKDRLEPQLPGYGFTYPVTVEMQDLGDSFFLHPDGCAIEFRLGENRLLTFTELKNKINIFYSKFKDNFDFLNVVYNVPEPEHIGASGVSAEFLPVNNCDFEGLGGSKVNESSAYGSGGKLKGVIVTYSRNGLGAIYHEIGHYWGAMDIGQEVVTLTGGSGRESAHWGISDVNGVLGGFKPTTLERNVDGTGNKYKASSPDGGFDDAFLPQSISSPYYAPIELYMMGLIGKEEVPDILLFKGVSGTATDNPMTNGVFYAEREETVTIEDIIAKYGERKPSYLESQKAFRMATVIVTQNPINDSEWNVFTEWIGIMEADKGKNGKLSFKETASGKATLQVSGLEVERK